MFCPRCRSGYPEGITRCPDCDLELIGELPPPARDEAEWVDLVTVLETGDPSLLLVAKSLLDAENIPSFAEGEGINEGLGAGRIAEADIPMGPGRLRVHLEDVEAARELLANLQPLDETEEPGS
jgi:hypothetical protein